MKATVFVTLKPGVLDPQGQATSRTLSRLGFDEVSDVRIGKYVVIEIDGQDREAARRRVTEMCEKLIANTVIEDFRVEVE
jgi:phosphoribosylformylglycinamidine synthase subunit PurS